HHGPPPDRFDPRPERQSPDRQRHHPVRRQHLFQRQRRRFVPFLGRGRRQWRHGHRRLDGHRQQPERRGPGQPQHRHRQLDADQYRQRHRRNQPERHAEASMIHGPSVRRFKAVVAASAIAALLTGCISASAGPQGTYATPIGNAPVTANPTPYSAALVCLADYARRYDLPSPRLAVGRIADYTGTVSADGGRQITGGASLQAISALAKAGARLVERYDTSVSEMELRYANNRLIGDPGPGGADDVEYRRILAGSVPGSDFYIVGGITEVNYNIRSGGFDMAAGQANSNTPLSTAFAGKAF